MLKIEGFGGKFQQGATTSSTSDRPVAPQPAVSSRPTMPTGSSRPLKTAPVSSFSLKQAMNETREDSPKEKTVARDASDLCVKAKDAFTGEKVKTALQTYITTLKADQAVKVALTSHPPKVEGFVITIEVDNDFLLERVNDLQPYLLSFLEKHLNNGYISLNVCLYVEQDDGREQKRLFTSKDKLDHFMAINPAVAELKTLFGLELE